jgi:hypothetical protein
LKKPAVDPSGEQGEESKQEKIESLEERLGDAEAELDKWEPVLVAADRVSSAYAAALAGRDLGGLPQWEKGEDGQLVNGRKNAPTPATDTSKEQRATEVWERVAPADLQAGDQIRLDVFDGQLGWHTERREVLSDDGRTFRMRGRWDGEDHEYDWVPAEDKHCNGEAPVQRVIDRLLRASSKEVGGDG